MPVKHVDLTNTHSHSRDCNIAIIIITSTIINRTFLGLLGGHFALYAQGYVALGVHVIYARG